jgi:hypothetical protein
VNALTQRELVGTAHTPSQWRGTIAMDNPQDFGVLQGAAGISGEWTVCGVEVYIGETGRSRAYVYAVKRSLIKDFDSWAEIANANDGAIPVTKFEVRGPNGYGTAGTVLLPMFKRVEIKASLRHALHDQGFDMVVQDEVNVDWNDDTVHDGDS